MSEECTSCGEIDPSEIFTLCMTCHTKDTVKLKQQLKEAESKVSEYEKILEDVGSKTHKSKLLYDWYCKNGAATSGYETIREI